MSTSSVIWYRPKSGDAKSDGNHYCHCMFMIESPRETRDNLRSKRSYRVWDYKVSPVYMSNCCIPVAQVATRRHLRSAARHQLTVPRHRLSTYSRRAFAVAGPMTFNTLPNDLRDPSVSTSTFGQLLKTPFSLPISTFSALGVSHVMRYINQRYLLTFLT